MAERGMNKVILVTRKTRLAELISKYNTIQQAQFYIEHLGADFSDYLKEDENYRRAVEQILECARKYARVQEIDREFVPNMIFGAQDIVIAVGQDGLIANVLKYLNGQMLIGVNPDTARWDGVLLPFEPGDMERVIPTVLDGRQQVKEITMAQAGLQDGQVMLAVNDLFVGQRTHVSARYDICWNRQRESQSSSGIIISTGLGATGWYKSILAQAGQIAEAFGYGSIQEEPLAWGDSRLTFVVREPYPSKATQAGIVFGKIGQQDEFRVVSKMPQGGVIFSDGMESDALEFASGMEVRIGVADRKGLLVC